MTEKDVIGWLTKLKDDVIIFVPVFRKEFTEALEAAIKLLSERTRNE